MSKRKEGRSKPPLLRASTSATHKSYQAHDHTQSSPQEQRYAERVAKGQPFLDVLAAVNVDTLTNAQLTQLFKLLVKYLQARMLHEGK